MKSVFTKTVIALLILNFSYFLTNAQISINEDGSNPDASAILDVKSADKGILIPRMDSTARNAISNPATGLMVYDSTTNSFWFYSTVWTELITEANTLTDADNDTKVEVEANTDEDIIRMTANGTETINIAEEQTKILSDFYVVGYAASSISFGNPYLNNFFSVINVSGNCSQTFTASNSGLVEKIVIRLGTQIETSYDFEIYDVASGQLLGSTTLSNPTTFSNNNLDFSNQNIVLEEGQMYSLSSSSRKGLGFYNADPYPGGELSFGTNYDLIFDIYLFEVQNVMSVVNNITNINDAYTLPNVDGTVNQVLTTDGNGTTSWADNTDNQELSFSNNTLSISNGTNTVDLSGYLDNTDDQTIDVFSLSGDNLQLSLESDGQSIQTVSLSSLKDNLGNHTATQNIQLNNNWLSNDGGNEGLRIDNNGQVGIGISSPNALLDLSDGSGNNDVLLRFNTERSWQFEEQGSGANTNLVLKSSSTGKNFNMLSSDGSTIASFRAIDGNGSKVGINKIIGSNDNTLEVNGNASKSTAGDWLANSDARLKKNIEPLESQVILNKLLDLQGVTYEWNDDKTGNERPEGLQYGFTAQNIQEVFPTLVTEDSKGYLQTAYGTYDAMYVEALRALSMENEKQNAEIEQLKIENRELKTQVSEIQQLKQQNAEMKAMLEQIQAQLNNNSDSINTGVSAEK